MNHEFDTIVDRIHSFDTRYHVDAYEFVMEALSYTQRKFRAIKHVTGEELLEGMKELLLDEYGPMTITVLKFWGINSTQDFGHIVFNLVNNSVLSQTQDDTIDTFKDAYDFQEVFDRGYRKQLYKKISRMRVI